MNAWNALRSELGWPGGAAAVLLCGAVAFALLGVRPLEQQSEELDRELGRAARAVKAGGTVPASGLRGFYRYFERGERMEDWLAKLYASASAAGLQFRSAEYRVLETRQRIERYQIALPLTGSYAQIRAFVENALVEIPVLSVDQITLRRKQVGDTRLEAEVVVSLHWVRP
jgi:hypothetical protein